MYSSIYFEKFFQSCKPSPYPPPRVKVENIFIIKTSLRPFQSVPYPNPSPQHLATTDLISMSAFPSMLYKWNHTVYSLLNLTSFTVQMLLNSAMLCMSSFFCIAEQYSIMITGMSHNFSIQYSFGCFQFGIIMNKDTINIHAWVIVWTYKKLSNSPRVALPLYMPTGKCLRSPVTQESHLNFVWSVYCYLSHYNWCVVVSYCTFNLHFSTD